MNEGVRCDVEKCKHNDSKKNCSLKKIKISCGNKDCTLCESYEESSKK